MHAPVVFQAQTEGVLSAARVRQAIGRTGASPHGALARLASWPVRALYRRADALAAISHAIEREALEAGVSPDRLHYLPNPVDAARFAPPSQDERRALRERLGVSPTAVVAVFVGRLSREKGVVELVKAWGLARPKARLVIVGPAMPGHPWDVSLEAKALAARLQAPEDPPETHGLPPDVRFMGGLPAEEVAAWLRAADFAVQPSHFEAMGLAAAEAMAAGLPVIASDTGGYRDFIRDGENGLLVPPRDVDALAAAITRLSADRPMRVRLGADARATAVSQFDEGVVLERFGQLIDGLAETR